MLPSHMTGVYSIIWLLYDMIAAAMLESHVMPTLLKVTCVSNRKSDIRKILVSKHQTYHYSPSWNAVLKTKQILHYTGQKSISYSSEREALWHY